MKQNAFLDKFTLFVSKRVVFETYLMYSTTSLEHYRKTDFVDK
jgi:hypothetical protein